MELTATVLPFLKMPRREYNFWTLVERAPDLPGQWIAHVLELDVVTQGVSPRHAIQMAAEAAFIVVVDDLRAGRDPLERRAPQEEWGRLWRFFTGPTTPIAQGDELDRSPFEIFAAQLWLAVELKEERPSWASPMVWGPLEHAGATA